MASYQNTTALIVVDVQNDFADAKGNLYVHGGEQVIPPINRQLARARAADATIVYTQDWHPAHTPHFQKDGGLWPVHCVKETWGAELHPSLKIDGMVVRKGAGGEDGYSGFTVADPRTGQAQPTGLEELLRKRGVTDVVVVGLATDYCVKATALDAVKHWPTTVLKEAVRAVNNNPEDAERAFDEMRSAGVTVR